MPAYYDSPSPCTEKLLTVNDCSCVGITFLNGVATGGVLGKKKGMMGRKK